MQVKHCVGVLIYNQNKEVLLIQNPKWKDGTYWMAPGGGIEDGETEEDAARREVQEELGINITNLVKLGEQKKHAGEDFSDSNLAFQFYDWAAEIVPNESITPDPREVKTYAWYTIDEAKTLPTTDSMHIFLERFTTYIKTL